MFSLTDGAAGSLVVRIVLEYRLALESKQISVHLRARSPISLQAEPAIVCASSSTTCFPTRSVMAPGGGQMLDPCRQDASSSWRRRWPTKGPLSRQTSGSGIFEPLRAGRHSAPGVVEKGSGMASIARESAMSLGASLNW